MAQMRTEAYVTLGRLSHVKMRHKSDAETMLAALEERVGGAFDSAVGRVRGEYDALKHNMDTLYRKSVQDLTAQKVALEKPTRARVELLEGQKVTAEQAEIQLTSILANADESFVYRELVNMAPHVNKVLKSSVKLIGMQFPEEGPLTDRDFPAGRLHNLVIAPKRSGDRRSAHGSSVNQQMAKPCSSSAPPLVPTKAEEEVVVEAAEVAGGMDCSKATGRGTGQRCCRNSHSKDRSVVPDWKDQVPPLENVGVKEAEVKATGGVPAREEQACNHCACACQAGDVWVAYGSLRKRYHALKAQADEEEIRARTQESRREMEEEFDRKRKELEAEFDQRREEMESKHGLSQAEMENLRKLVQASIKESQEILKESMELREKVAQGEKQLEQALRESSDAKKEIEQRKQHTNILLSRIRELKLHAAACVGNAGGNVGEGPGAGVVPPSPSSGCDFSSDDESSCSDTTDDILSVSASADIDGRRGAYPTTPCTSSSVPPEYDSDADSEIEDQKHKMSSEADVAEDRHRPSARVRPLRGEGSLRELELEREREHLARQVNDLTAQLAAAGVNVDVDDETSSCDSNDVSSELSSTVYTSSTTYTTSEQTGASRGATTTEEATSSHHRHYHRPQDEISVAAAAAAAASEHETERLASRRQWRNTRHSRLRQVGKFFSSTSSCPSSSVNRRGYPESNGSGGSDSGNTWEDYVGRVDQVGQQQNQEEHSTFVNGNVGRGKAGFWQEPEIDNGYWP